MQCREKEFVVYLSYGRISTYGDSRKEDIQVPDRRYERYEYQQNLRQGGGNMRNDGQRRQAPSGSAGGQRPSQPRPQGTVRPAGSAQRSAGSAPQRGYAASGAPARPPQQRTSGGYGQQSRPAQSRPQGSSARIVQNGAAQRRSGQYPPDYASGNARRAPAPSGSRRPAHGGGSGRAGGNGISPALRFVCLALVTVMLMTASVLIADQVISRQPRPVISMSAVDDPVSQPTDQLVVSATNEPAATDISAASPTDAPASPTDAPTAPTDAPADSVVPVGNRSVTIRAIGDVIINQTTLDNCETGDEVYDFSPLFELVSGVMSDADWTMINIEGTLRRHSKYGYMGYPQFFTPHSILEDLKAVGVDMLTMCNNHALDGWYDGLKMSLDYADAAGLAHVGAYRTQQEHDTPEIYDLGGIRVGMVNYTQYTNSMESKCDPEAVIYGMRLMRDADYEGDIAALKNAGAEFTIAIMHWGTEYVREPDDDIEEVARRLVAAGVDLVIGGHPHVVQPAEYVTATQADGTQNTALVIYSLGNFYSEHRKSNTDNGVIFEFTLSDSVQGGVEMSSPALIPIYMWQNEGAGAYEFRAVPSGVYLDNPPAGMSSDQYSRMVESYNETVQLIGGVVEIKAD